MACLPELAPADRDHLLRSTSVVQQIAYQPFQITYRTAIADGTQRFRLTFEPLEILADGRPISRQGPLQPGPGWAYDPALRVLDVRSTSREVLVRGR
jgi:hypothetical protein